MHGTDIGKRLQLFLFVGVFTYLLLVYQNLSAPGDEMPDAISVATWNVEWFFDDYHGNNRSDLAKRLSAPTAKNGSGS